LGGAIDKEVAMPRSIVERVFPDPQIKARG